MVGTCRSRLPGVKQRNHSDKPPFWLFHQRSKVSSKAMAGNCDTFVPYLNPTTPSKCMQQADTQSPADKSAKFSLLPWHSTHVLPCLVHPTRIKCPWWASTSARNKRMGLDGCIRKVAKVRAERMSCTLADKTRPCHLIWTRPSCKPDKSTIWAGSCQPVEYWLTGFLKRSTRSPIRSSKKLSCSSGLCVVCCSCLLVCSCLYNASNRQVSDAGCVSVRQSFACLFTNNWKQWRNTSKHRLIGRGIATSEKGILGAHAKRYSKSFGIGPVVQQTQLGSKDVVVASTRPQCCSFATKNTTLMPLLSNHSAARSEITPPSWSQSTVAGQPKMRIQHVANPSRMLLAPCS